MSPTGSSNSPSIGNDHHLFTCNDIVDLVSKCVSKSSLSRVCNFKIEPFSKETLGFAGVYDLLTIEVSINDDLVTLSFFVKTMSPYANAYQRTIFTEELKFFREVIPRLLDCYEGQFWTAKCFMIKGNVLVMEDLRAKGYKITNRLSDGQLKSAIVSIARFHAASMLLEDKLQRSLDQICPGYFEEKLFLKDNGTNWQFLLAGIEVVETVAENNLKLLVGQHISSAYDWLQREIKPKRDEKNVLCHCDLWCNNLMFNDKDDCLLVDFQQAVYTSHIVDLVQFVHLNIDRLTKRRLEMELLQIYHCELNEQLKRHEYTGEMLTLRQLTNDFEKKRIIGLITAVQTLPLALLNSQMSLQFTKDDEHFKRYMFESRKDFVLNAMQEDKNYRMRIEEVVEDLIVFMDKFVGVER